jgi:glutaredoxin
LHTDAPRRGDQEVQVKIIFQTFAFLAVTLLAATAATVATAQTVYKSIGPDGATVYSDHPPADGKIEKTITFADLPSSPVPPDLPKTETARPPAAVATSRPNGDVLLYAASWCGYCKRAKAYLAKRQIQYQEIDIDTPQGKSWFAQAGGRGVPLLVAQGRYIRGFTAEGYTAFFANR